MVNIPNITNNFVLLSFSSFIPGAGFMTAEFQQRSGEQTPSVSVFNPEPMKKKISVKIVVMVGFLILILVGLIANLEKVKSFLSRAEGGCIPENLVEAEVTPNSAEITFQTEKACQVEVNYGTSSGSMLLRAPETVAVLDHRVRLTPLLPSTTYYYQVVVGGKKVSETRSFMTKLAMAPTQVPVVVPTTAITVAPGGTGSYTIEDFQANFGRQNTIFDIDKDGVVSIRDWILYQKTSQ